MTTPILSHFPASILTAIFSYFCKDGPVYLPMGAADKRHILRLVCARWDDIILSTHVLWTNIFFSRPQSHFPSPGFVLNQFSLCTTRSGNKPLTIAFDMGRTVEWPFSIVNSVILQHIHRIRHLTCPILSNADIIAFLTIPGGQFSALESINIAFANTWTRPLSFFPLHFSQQFVVFDAAPRLRAITAHVRNGLHVNDLHLPWERLTSIDLGSTVMTPEGFVEFARHAAKLEDAVFLIEFRKPLFLDRVLSHQEIIMHRLRTLRLRLVFPRNDPRLFSLLQFPILVSLSIQVHDVYEDWDASLYATFLRSSSPTLRQLSITGFPALGFQFGYRALLCLEDLFDVIPNVNILHLPLGLYIPIPTMELLASCNLLPQLRILELGCTVDGVHHMFSVFTKRHENAISLKPLAGPRPSLIKHLRMSIPNYHYSEKEGAALTEQKELLKSLGTIVDVAAPNVLPLPAFH